MSKAYALHLTTPTVATLALVPSGTPGIRATLRAMSQFVRDGKKSMPVRERAMALTMQCPPKDYACEVRVLHAFVRDSIRYVQDIDGVETVATPQKTLEYSAGDCDDKSVLLAALLGSIGHPTRFVAVSFEPEVYSHVYVETRIGANWIALETTEPVDMGWSPADVRAMAMPPLYHHNH